MPGTETSPIFGLSIWAGAQSAPWEVENTVQRAFEALLRGSVADRDLTAPPGSCADGAAYLIAATATGAWATHDGEMAVAVGADAANGWIFLPVATEGMRLHVDDEDLVIKHTGAAWVLADYYDVPLSYAGGPPVSSEILFAMVTARDIYFPADFAGSYGYIGTNPTASFAIDVQDDGVSIGTITVGTGGAFTFATASNTAKTVAKGSRIEFIAPGTVDTTAAYILAALAGYAK